MNAGPRRVAVFTGNRSEYGLQYPVLRAIAEDDRLDYALIVAGAHLDDRFGRTAGEIEGDGFRVARQIAMEAPDDSLHGTTHVIGTGVVRIGAALAELRPDLLLVYGDRLESFAAAIAGTQMGIPTAHVEGGDYTDGGALDDSVRHAVTKLAHLHFTTNREAAARVLALGEEPWRVFEVGLPALDLIAQGLYATADEVRARFALPADRPLLVVTQHAVATQWEEAGDQVRPLLHALSYAAAEWGCQALVTFPNNDAGGRRILAELRGFERVKPQGIHLVPSLGRFYYHGALAIAAACVGNSSSGIKETPAFRCPAVDIGTRQRGRLRAGNVLHADYDEAQIRAAIGRCLFDEAFRAEVASCHNPYGSGNAGARIAGTLATVPLDRRLVQKRHTY
jgi:UDP-N-acetylglucosamine 2-epimerase (non-hydrolysing)/GDP/UDP-N,N'-diacetylbacillosamine 2-epimerase (hydrolysing)